ncbi:MAG: YgiT-type zinc finger protein [Alphaproteobacteria bacterium]|nr:YgiT-type zinc finger protein [Alphaproteobacteria bacterium]
MKCPACGSAALRRETRDRRHVYRGAAKVIRAVKGEYCPACGEAVLGPGEARRVSAAMTAFNRRVNAASVDPAFISAVRKKLRLDQRQAAKVFGGGVNAFSRYETGKARPPVALIKLLKVLDRHPRLRDEVLAT